MNLSFRRAITGTIKIFTIAISYTIIYVIINFKRTVFNKTDRHQKQGRAGKMVGPAVTLSYMGVKKYYT
jgi:hypothetical protein